MGERIDQERERASGFSALGRMRLNINPSLFKKRRRKTVHLSVRHSHSRCCAEAFRPLAVEIFVRDVAIRAHA